MKSSAEIRKQFLEFFRERQHQVVESDSLIPSSDPTLLFTSAGMVQFKDLFLGRVKKGYTRAATCQKCFRTSDIERVGHTVRHLTFFEMLGNFSFGDYFKMEIIPWSWEFLTVNMGLDKNRMYPTIYKDDDEAAELWKKIVPAERIIRLGEESNFWNMGPTGPCGPCSEIIYDRGEKYGCNKPDCGPGCDCDRWLEIWNLVFTQFDRAADGKLSPLPQKNIDTGMGLERLCMVVQEKDSCFETDLFSSVVNYAAELLKLDSDDQNKAVSILRMIADHARGTTFLISDGILPSNEGRGYVLRRILRRAVRGGKILGQNSPFVYKLSGKVIEVMKDVYPGLVNLREQIANVIKMEEEKFLETLDTGSKILDELVTKLEKSKKLVLDGNAVFKLYDTYGFPPDLTQEIVQEKGMSIDWAEFKRLQEESKEVARQSWKKLDVTTMSDNEKNRYIGLHKQHGDTRFCGYETEVCDTQVLAILKNGEPVAQASTGDEVNIVLQETPFYTESGGQLADSGKFRTFNDKLQIEVGGTFKPVAGLVVHKSKVVKGELKTGDNIMAEVNTENRRATQRNHTATHILHKALRQVLGKHVVQSGSLVTPDRLRFDFTHPKSLTGEEIDMIEDIANNAVISNYYVKTLEITLSKAKELGAMALFGEKYGDKVRCVMITSAANGWDVPDKAFSIELCGGTHCKYTGEIGLIKVVSESSIAAGVRRIEAATGKNAYALVKNLEQERATIAEELRTNPAEILGKLRKVLQNQKELEKEVDKLNKQLLEGDRTQDTEHKGEVEEVNGIKLLAQVVTGVNRKVLGEHSDKLKQNIKSGVIVLGTVYESKPMILVSVTPDLVDKGFDAGKIVNRLAQMVGGSGGGRKDFAQAGGKEPDKLAEAIAQAKAVIAEML